MEAMAPPWMCFEQLEEIVYVINMETYELVYLNRHGRESFLADSEEPYVGKKCYQTLQGYEGPCPFCNNEQLAAGEFVTWSYRNPILRRSFLMWDTIVRWEGRDYRLEFAADASDRPEDEARVKRAEELINESLLIAHSTQDLDEAIRQMLQYLGTHMACQALHVYEMRDDSWAVNTYAWTRSGLRPDRKPMYIGFIHPLKQWYEMFAHNEPLVIRDVQKFCRRTPELCRILQAPQLQRLILLPLIRNGTVVGFWRVDEPAEDRIEEIVDIGKIISHFLASMLEQRDLIRSLEDAGLHDQLTGALNRYALTPYLSRTQLEKDTGLVYCDLNGLKKTNDRFGHASGDRLIIQAFHILGSVFTGDQIFRMGGDEFLVLCEGVELPRFEERVARLREAAQTNGCGMAVGSVWYPAGEGLFSDLLDEADQRMYWDKRRASKEGEGAAAAAPQPAPSELPVPEQTPVRTYLEHCYFDVDSFLRSLCMEGSAYYVYFGDVRRNLYYISDNLKEDFGFSDSLVRDFIHELERKIYGPDQEMHMEDYRSMLRDKREVHSIRYRIYDKNGELSWLHCRGILKWDENRIQPLFFSGSMISLKNEAEVDPVTGLLNLPHALRQLEELNSMNARLMLLCVAFREFQDINRVFGRDLGNALLKEVSGTMERTMEEDFTFYRLDGVRFLAVSSTVFAPQEPARRIREIVREVFHKYKVPQAFPCAIGVVHSGKKAETPQQLLDEVMATASAAKGFPNLDFLESVVHLTEQYQLHSDLGMALNESVEHGFSGFHTVVQPLVEADSGRIWGGETLLRWRSKSGESVSPVAFVPVLEQSGLILPVGKWVLEQTLRHGRRLLDLRPDFSLTVNVSYIQAVDQSFFPFLKEKLEQCHVPPENLYIELTETNFDRMPDHLQRFVDQCRALGVRFALDDFGSAYSGLQVLLRYPADLIKLDRDLKKQVTSSKENERFVKSLVYACHQFNQKVCVEGVETEEDLNVIRNTGCDYIQGFYFYKPMEWSELESLVNAGEPPAGGGESG